MATPQAPLVLFRDLIPKGFPSAHDAIVHLADLLSGKGCCTVQDGDQQQGAWSEESHGKTSTHRLQKKSLHKTSPGLEQLEATYQGIC